MGELLFELLLAFAELFLEVLLEFAGEALLDLALRAVAEVFESFRVAGPVIASVGYTPPRCAGGWIQPSYLSASPCASIKLHGINLLVQPYRYRFGDVVNWVHAEPTGQESDSNRELSLRIAFAFGMALISISLSGLILATSRRQSMAVKPTHYVFLA